MSQLAVKATALTSSTPIQATTWSTAALVLLEIECLGLRQLNAKGYINDIAILQCVISWFGSFSSKEVN